MAILMYEAWTKHGKLPSEIYNASKGDIEILKGLYEFENKHMKGNS